MKHIKTIVPTVKGPFFTSCPDPNIKRIEIFKDEQKADQVEIRFVINPKSEEQIHQQLLDGLNSGCSATEGAEVPKISFSKPGTLASSVSTAQEPLLSKGDQTTPTEISIQGYSLSVLSALGDSFDFHKFPLKREYLNEITQNVLGGANSVPTKPAEESKCAIL
jgi:hypothetical protein